MSTASTPGPPDLLALPGLDGTNPLGFLAALGLLHVLDSSPSAGTVKMTWKPSGGTWTPALRVAAGPPLSEDALLAVLGKQLIRSIDDHPARLLAALVAVSNDQEKRRDLIREIAEGGDRLRMNWTAAIASDAVAAESNNQLQTARKDYFYGNLKSILNRTEQVHLRRALFRLWDYADALENQSLHWAPSEDRRHAHQWNKPSGDPDRKKSGGMLGANRLALEAIPIFTSVPEGGSLRTLGFTGSRSKDTRWTWPIWDAWLPLPVVRSLLAAPALQEEKIEGDEVAQLKAQGVAAVYRTRRILVGKTPNFTPALCIA